MKMFNRAGESTKKAKSNFVLSNFRVVVIGEFFINFKEFTAKPLKNFDKS